MSIPGYSVKNRVTMTMFYLGVIAFGIFSFMRLQLDLYPDMDIPYILVMTTYIGASPADIETLVSRPIEENAVSVTGVKNVTSTSKENVGIVVLEFDWGYDMDQAEIDTRNNLDLVRDKLPDDADEPIVIAMDPSMSPIVMINLQGDMSSSEIRQVAEDRIQPMLERIDGIASVEVGGGEARQIHVRLDPKKLEAYKISPLSIVQMIGAENAQAVGGYIEDSGMDLNIQSQGKFTNVEEMGEILLGAGQNNSGAIIPIRLKDVAEIEDTIEESRRYLEANERSSVMLIISKQSGANTVDAAKGVLDALPKVIKSVPGLSYTVVNDQSEFIISSIGNLKETCVLAVIIVFFVLLMFFKSITTSLIVATAIPISLMATFGFMSSMGMTMNVISMAGLALAVGMLVDNSIVTLENIFRHREEGDSAFQACVRGAKEIMMAITASTLTTLAVFLPILFVPGIAGMMFRDMSLTICGALVISLLVAVTFVPMLSYYMLKSPKFDKTIKSNSGNEVEDLSTLSESEKASFMNCLRRGYEAILEKLIAVRAVVVLVVVAIFVFACYGFTKVPMEFMPQSDDSYITINITTEIGNDARTTYEIMKECNEIVKQIIPPEERILISLDSGSADSGFSSIMSNGVHTGKIRVKLVKPKFRERGITQIIDDVRTGLKKVPGITYQVTGRSMGGSSGADIDIEVYNDDIQETRKVTNRIRRAMLERPDISEVKLSVDEQKPQIKVDFDRQKMSELGLNTSTVGNLIYIYFRGMTASYYLDKGDEYDIIVRYDRSYRNDIHQVENMPLTTNTGAIVPLSTVAHVYENLAPTAIERKNQERYQQVSLTLTNAYVDPVTGKTVKKDLAKTISEVSKYLDEQIEIDAQRGFEWRYSMSGTAENFQDSFKYLFIALMISVVLVYMVMASQFENYRQPFIVLLTVPLAIIGVSMIYLLTGRTLDMSGLIGIIMLVGIVVNNGIVMVDAANQNRARGMAKNRAVVSAARTRMRPVMMTALTTILSMVPLALELGEGSETWAGMGTTVIGGMTVATFMTLFFIPVMYSIIAPKKFVIEESEDEGEVISATERNAARESQVSLDAVTENK